MNRTSFIILAALLLTVTGCVDKGAKPAPDAAVAEAESAARQPASGTVHQLTAAAFRKNIMDYAADSARWQYLGDRPAVIDFYATWCGPCRSMTPIVEEAAKRYAGDVVFYKVDIDEETELAQFFGIQSIPFFLFIPMQGTPAAQTGAMDAESFDRMVREIVKP